MGELEPVCPRITEGLLVMYSGGASSGKAIQKKYGNVHMAFTDNPKASATDYWYDEGIPVVINDFEKFYKGANQPDLKNMETRKPFDKLSVRRVDACARRNKISIGAVVASGYMKKTTDVWLNRFPNSMLNMHPAKLSVKDELGRRKYTGDSAVLKALKAGETETYSTVHLMNDLPDQGPIVAVSKPLPVKGLTDEIKADKKAFQEFAGAHQSVMKDECDIPTFLYVIKLLSEHAVGTDGKIIYVDDEPYPNGIEVGAI